MIVRRKRFKFHPKFYALAVLAGLVIIGLLVLFIPGRSWGVTSSSGMMLNLDVKTAIIRKEECVAIEKYDQLMYIAGEGDTVNEGDTLAWVLKWGYSEDMLQSVLMLENEIYDEQMRQLDGIEDGELAALDAGIDEVKRLIRACIMTGEGEDLQLLEQRLCAELAKRSAYLRDKVYATETLTALYREEEIRNTQFEQWRSTIAATTSGRVSFYFDGFEQALNADKLDILTSELLASAIKGNKAGSSSDDEMSLLYRIVEPNTWYCAFLTNAADPVRLVKGQEYSVVFDGYSGSTYRGVALEAKVSGKKVVNILQINSDIGDFIGVRSIKAAISAQVSGVEVNTESIQFEKGIPYIVLADGNNTRIEIEVYAVDGSKAIVRAKNARDTLVSGQKYVKERVSNFTRIKEKLGL